MLLLHARMSSKFRHQKLTTKFAANFYRLDEHSKCGTS